MTEENGQVDGRGAGLSSVRNAARLLCAFTPADRDVGVSELATRLGLGKSTVHRLLSTLALEGLIERDPASGRYRLGLKLYELGSIVGDHFDLHEVVAGPIDDLRNRTGETVHVAILDGSEVVYIARRESPHTLRMFGRVGHRNHAHCTSTGKLLLAFLPPPDLAKILDAFDLPAHTRFTITDRAKLEDEIEAIRRRGWAENVQESELGAHSVAAPIRDTSGRVVAAISVAGPAARFTPEVMRRVAVDTVRTGEAISARLGWRPRESSIRPPGPVTSGLPVRVQPR
ncbi:MAG: IclR family transcriptional regulator [Actinomycetota bacterium]